MPDRSRDSNSIYPEAHVRRAWASSCLAVLATCALTACSTGPEWDRRVGERYAPRLVESLGQLDDPSLEAYTDRIGERLVEHLGDTPFDYEFTLLDTETPNALAMPGGHVFVTRGLLPLFNTEDQLAVVLAHEIIHSEARHAAQQRDRAVVPGALALPGRALGRVLPGAETLLASPWDLAGGAFLAAYSREHEREADRAGQALARAAGFDPSALPRFLEQIAAHEQTLGRPHEPTVFDTHPPTPSRIQNTRIHAISLGVRTRPVPPDPVFLRRLDGLIVGPNPAHGVFLGDRFVHPTRDLAVDFPEGWSAIQHRTVFGAIAQDRRALVLFAAPVDGDDPAAAAQPVLDAIAQRGIEPLIDTADTVHGLPRVHVRLDAGQNDGQPLILDLTWVAHRGRVHPSIAVVPGDRLSLTAAAVDSVRPLTQTERDEGLPVRRLRLWTADGRTTLRQLAQRHGVSATPDELAAYNGVTPDTRLEPGRAVKLVRADRYRPPVD
ncbi:MAG: M48 family metalloprotease [Planctomycetota bacterium]